MQPSSFIYYPENQSSRGIATFPRNYSNISIFCLFTYLLYHKKKFCQGVLKNFFKKFEFFSFLLKSASKGVIKEVDKSFYIHYNKGVKV